MLRHGVRRFRIDQADKETCRVELRGFDSECEVAGLGNLFDTRLGCFLFLVRTENIEILFVNLVDELAVVPVRRIRSLFGAARCRYHRAWRGNGRESRRVEDFAYLVSNREALIPIDHGNRFEDTIRENRRAQVARRVKLEVPNEPDVMAAERKFRQFGHGDFFAAEHRDRADESVVGIRTPVFDGQVRRDVLVQILEHRERVFLVTKERRRLQLCVACSSGQST